MYIIGCMGQKPLVRKGVTERQQGVSRNPKEVARQLLSVCLSLSPPSSLEPHALVPFLLPAGWAVLPSAYQPASSPWSRFLCSPKTQSDMCCGFPFGTVQPSPQVYRTFRLKYPPQIDCSFWPIDSTTQQKKKIWKVTSRQWIILLFQVFIFGSIRHG